MGGRAPLRHQRVVSNAEQVAAKRGPGLVARGVLENGDEDVVRELFGAGRRLDAAPEEAPDGPAIPLEQRLERLPRAGTHAEHQLFVSDHGAFEKPLALK